ncbi:hypothetical protein ACJMK2_025421 [Sinanodonta woodiana]|uniref:Uncharacterized protein n=1 Tax=Sinanodonta woodiana TaxID=1069815 RepID=A0ABD3XH02_SINWO
MDTVQGMRENDTNTELRTFRDPKQVVQKDSLNDTESMTNNNSKPKTGNMILLIFHVPEILVDFSNIGIMNADQFYLLKLDIDLFDNGMGKRLTMIQLA